MTDENTDTETDQQDDWGTVVEREEGDGMQYQPPDSSRRDVMKWLGAVAGGVSISSFGLAALWGLSDAGLASLGNDGKLYTKGTRLVNREGESLKVGEALPKGKGEKMLVLPEKKNGKALKKKKATTLLLRFTEDTYKKPTRLKWTTNGYVAYSMVCTHAGCLVDGRLEGTLHCPCHGSQYEATEGAKVVGGPAPRALPQLPLGVSKNGELLVATGPFEGPIGPK